MKGLVPSTKRLEKQHMLGLLQGLQGDAEKEEATVYEPHCFLKGVLGPSQ